MRQVRWAMPVLALLLVGVGCGDDNNNGGGTPKPTATRTSTRTPTVAVPTVTPGGPTLTPTTTQVAQATNTPGGSFTGAPKVQRFLSGVLSTVSSLSDFAGGGSSRAVTAGRAEISLPPIAVPCLSGGTIQTGCTPDASGSQLSFTFAGCTTSASGVRTFLDGTLGIDSPSGCPGVPLPVGEPFGVVVDARIEASGRGRNVAGSFDVNETVTRNADGSSSVDATGTVDTECTGPVSFETVEPIFYPADAVCATAGQIRVALDEGDSLVTFTDGGGLEIDYGADGSVDDTYSSCTDSKLKKCN